MLYLPRGTEAQQYLKLAPQIFPEFLEVVNTVFWNREKLSRSSCFLYTNVNTNWKVLQHFSKRGANPIGSTYKAATSKFVCLTFPPLWTWQYCRSSGTKKSEKADQKEDAKKSEEKDEKGKEEVRSGSADQSKTSKSGDLLGTVTQKRAKWMEAVWGGGLAALWYAVG